MRRIYAVLAAAVLGLLASAGHALAQAPGGSAEQAAANAAASAQSALSLAGTAAAAAPPPLEAPSVSQSNAALAASAAGNGNATSQTAGQTASGTGTQAAGQIAGNDQTAVGTADATQLGAANQNVAVRVLSPGHGGSVSQANTALAGSLAGNGNQTTQAANQSLAGGPGSGSQTVGQAASNEQDAASHAAATQHGAKNTNVSVRIFSPGDDGTVEQSNTVAGIAAGQNGNSTSQSAAQGASGGGGTQAVLQGTTSSQGAESSADAEQKGATNENIAVRIFSPGKSGAVSQSNTALAASAAKNGNATTQGATQSRAGGPGSGQQVVGQAAASHQDAWADSHATQDGAANTNIPVRIFSDGDDGAVEQSNSVVGLSAALNGNGTTQTAGQTQSGAAPVALPVSYADAHPYGEKAVHPKPEGTGVQAIGQAAESKQTAVATSDATQAGASNTNVPVRIGSEGGSGSVSQANTTTSAAIAANENGTSQSASQSQSGQGTLVQAIGQAAKSHQGALALSDAVQLDATNTNAPVRLFGTGDDGSVAQSNTAAAIAGARNGNSTTQSAGQTQSGGSPLVQAVGQAALNHQGALATGNAYQRGVGNANMPVGVGYDLDGHRCERREGRCEPKRPVEPPTCDWKQRECAPTHPREPRCGSKRDGCEWSKPVVPRRCEARLPKLEPCGRCERPDGLNCPDRRWETR